MVSSQTKDAFRAILEQIDELIEQVQDEDPETLADLEILRADAEDVLNLM
jgi:HPt (histidine-containing phosphotransfer) domain-containing protein